MASINQSPPNPTPSLRHRLRNARHTAATKTKKGLLACLGPGLIAGASDDDPSGIATYSQTGAQFGFAMLWVMLFTLPLMAAIQEIAARIGRVTGRGLARNMRLQYSPWIVYPIVLLLVLANILNLGADIGAMGESVHLITGGPAFLRIVYALALTLGSLLLQIFVSYTRYTNILKYMSMTLLIYVVTAFAIQVPWKDALFHALVPTINWDKSYIALLVGVLGTTISPYLFFWQASLESEQTKVSPDRQPLQKAPEQTRESFRRIRWDTYGGMAFSNSISFFIILCAAATLHNDPNPAHHTIDSAGQAAAALAPLAGRFASTLFALGILSGGLLAIPSLAGSAAYAVGELFHWPVGMERTPRRAKGFYMVLTLSTLLSVGIVLSPINPIHALVWSAIINGLTAVPVMLIIMLLFSNPKIMGSLTRISKTLRLIGWLATLVMTAAAIGFFATLGN